jgi:23S rRNA (pseudouridine1915-N3)-methyltransferase
MKIRIISFGKIKTAEIKNLVDYYYRLTTKYVNVEKIELKDKEGKIGINEIKKYIGNGVYLITLSENGREFTTMEFASKLKMFKDNSQDITILIGNAYGIERAVIETAQLNLSLGKFTYPHEIAYLLLIEQLFRCSNVLAGGKYHKE